MQRFHKTSQQWRREGSQMAIGVSGTTYRRKIYAVVVVDDDWKVVKAGALSGWTIASTVDEVDELVGMDLDDIGRGDPPEGVNPKAWAALDHAASFIRTKRDRELRGLEDRGGGEGPT
jgi:DNA-binding transcriptional regulator of glucitol operon